MSPLSKRLLGLLVLQLLLALIVYAGHRGTARGPAKLLAGFDPARVASIEIAPPMVEGVKDGKPAKIPGEAIVLRNGAHGWVLASQYGYPADPTKLDVLLDAIRDAEASAPIAVDPSRHASLRVGDQDFDRKIDLTMKNGKVVTLLVGLTTGQTAAVRIAGHREVFESTRITPWSAPADARGWMNTVYAQHAAIDLTAVEITNTHGTWRLDRRSGDWQLSLGGAPVVAPAGTRLDTDLIRQLPSRAAVINAVAPADPAMAAPLDQPAPAILRVFTHRKPDPDVYEIYTHGARYYVRAQPPAQAGAGAATAVFVNRDQLATLVELTIATVVTNAP